MYNHGSFLDPPIMSIVLDWHGIYLGKEELFKYPIIDRIFRHGGGVPIRRENLESAKHSLHEVEERVINDQIAVIAPEGTRKRETNIEDPNSYFLEFKKGPFHVVKNAGARIVPVFIDGASRLRKVNQIFNLPGTIYVDVFEPIGREIVNDPAVSHEDLRKMTYDKYIKNFHIRSNDEVIGKPFSNHKEVIGYLVGHLIAFYWVFK